MMCCKKICFFFLVIFLSSCTQREVLITQFDLKTNPIIDDSLAVFTQDISFDGNGSLHLGVQSPKIIKLYEIENLREEDCALTYFATVKTENWQGNCYLEMWCFIGESAYFSRSLDQIIYNDTNWIAISTPFFLKQGQIAEKVKLNLVADGTGDIWIDSIKLTKKR